MKTDHELQMALAKALPQIVRLNETGDWFLWQEGEDESEMAIITDREWLAVMHEAEKALGSFKMPMDADSLPGKYWDALADLDTATVHASWQQRALAFLKVQMNLEPK